MCFALGFYLYAPARAHADQILIYDADGDILIGHVKDEKGNSAYWIVNYDEESLFDGNHVNVDIEFKNDYNQTYQFIKGEKKAVAISNESINLSLESGQGVFIIPYHD